MAAQEQTWNISQSWPWAACYRGKKQSWKKLQQWERFSIQVKWKMCPHAGVLSVILANSTLHLDRIHRALEVESKKMKELRGQWVSLSLVGISTVTYNLSMDCVSLKMKIKLPLESLERAGLDECSSYSRTTKFLMILSTVGDKWKCVSNFCNTCFVSVIFRRAVLD